MNDARLLFGASSGNIYDAKARNELEIKNAVFIQNTCRKASQNYLKTWIKRGENMASFVALLYPQSGSPLDVLESLGASLISYLHSLRLIFHLKIYRPLVDVNDHFLKQRTELRLNTFIEFLMDDSMTRIYDSLDLLTSVHKEITDHESFECTFRCSAHLVDVLYSYLDIESDHLRQIIWKMFMNALRPTLTYIQKLLTYGYADDPFEEFFFDYGHCSIRTDANFWDTCLVLRDQEALPFLIQPLMEPLILGVKSRLVLTGTNHTPASNFSQTNMMSQLQDLLKSLLILKEQNSKSDMDYDSFSEDDSGQCESYSEPHVESDMDTDPAESKHEMDLLSFPNMTCFDDVYYETNEYYKSDNLLDVMSKEFVETETNGYDMTLPDEPKSDVKMAIVMSLHSVIKSYTDEVSRQLMFAFKEKYIECLTIHTDYYLLHKSSPNVSEYLYSLFTQITESPSSNMSLTHYRSIEHELDEAHSVRAFLVFSWDETHDPLRILDRMNILYGEMDPFTPLLLNPSSKQILADAFHFLLILKYSKWTMDSLKETTSDASLNSSCIEFKSKHGLFLLRFRFLYMINSLHYYLMLMLDQEISCLILKSRGASDFNQLKECLDRFTSRVAKYTFQGTSEKNKRFVHKMAQVAIRLRTLFHSDLNNNQQILKDIVSLDKKLGKLEVAVSHFCEASI